MMTLPVRRRPTRFCWIETPGCFSVNMPGLRFQPGGSPAEEAPRSLEDEWYESEKQEQAQTRQQFWFYYHNQHRLSWTPRFSCFPSQLLWLIRFRVSNFVHAASKTDPNPIFSLKIWICTTHWIWHFQIRFRPLPNVGMNRIRIRLSWMRPWFEQPGRT